MLRVTILLFCLIAASCNASSNFVDQCNSLKNELGSQSRLTDTNFDLKFSGSVDAFGGELSHYTLLSFGVSSLKIPFVGDEQINLSPSVESVVKKTDAGSLLISFFDDAKYRDVGSELLNLKESSSPLFDKPVLHGWLAYKGFEHTTADLKCSGEESVAQKVIAYLSAKVLLAESGAKVFKLKEYDVGFVQIKKSKDIAALVVLEGDNALKITFKAKPETDIFNWLGIKGHPEDNRGQTPN